MRQLWIFAKRVARLMLSRPVKTLYLNFKMLPFRQAVRLPILIIGDVSLVCLKGKIVIEAERISPFMIRIGERYVQTSRQRSIWKIEGTLIFKGGALMTGGVYLAVSESGVLTIGRDSLIESDSRIFCYERITIGDKVQLTWFSQVYDTAFHYVADKMGGVKPITAPIVIGDYVWVGNNTTITKGAVIPGWSIVGSHSLVNKDFSDIGGHCMLAGVPAKVKQEGVTRVFDHQKERAYDEQFGYIRIKS